MNLDESSTQIDLDQNIFGKDIVDLIGCQKCQLSFPGFFTLRYLTTQFMKVKVIQDWNNFVNLD